MGDTENQRGDTELRRTLGAVGTLSAGEDISRRRAALRSWRMEINPWLNL